MIRKRVKKKKQEENGKNKEKIDNDGVTEVPGGVDQRLIDK